MVSLMKPSICYLPVIILGNDSTPESSLCESGGSRLNNFTKAKTARICFRL